jgi:hypothetical protein
MNFYGESHTNQPMLRNERLDQIKEEEIKKKKMLGIMGQ